MTNMKDAVEKFKQENGNQNFTLKEMIILNNVKIDEMKEALTTHLVTAATDDGVVRGKVSILAKNVRGLWGVIGMLVAAFIAKFK